MYPHPVYVPIGEIRELRALLSQRRVLHPDYQRWRYRAVRRPRGSPRCGRPSRARADELADGIGLSRRLEATLRAELQRVDAALGAASIDAVRRLMTSPGIGVLVATAIYAWVGDVRRFPSTLTPHPGHQASASDGSLPRSSCVRTRRTRLAQNT